MFSFHKVVTDIDTPSTYLKVPGAVKSGLSWVVGRTRPATVFETEKRHKYCPAVNERAPDSNNNNSNNCKSNKRKRWGRGRHRHRAAQERERGGGKKENSHMHKLHTYARLSADIVRYVAETEGAGCERNKVRGGGSVSMSKRVSGVVAKRIRKSCLLASQFAGAAYGSAMQISRLALALSAGQTRAGKQNAQHATQQWAKGPW